MRNILIISFLLIYPLSAFAIQDATIATFNQTIMSVEASQPTIPKGTSGTWDDGGMRETSNVLYDPGDADATKRYKFIFPGFLASAGPTNEHAGYAYSADGITWTKYSGNPVGTWALEDPYELVNAGTYYMYYEDKADGTRIGLRTSSDFITWGSQTVALTKGTAGDWDDQDVSSPVNWIEGGTWYMLFEGRKSGGQQGAIGLATSSDGITWTEYVSNPVMSKAGGNVWDNNAIVPDDIIKIGSTYYMIYHGQNLTSSIFQWGIATSTDLHTWVRNSGNPYSFQPGWSNAQPFTALNGNHYMFQMLTNTEDHLFQFVTGKGIDMNGVTINGVSKPN